MRGSGWGARHLRLPADNNPMIRRLLIGSAFLALIVGILGQIVMPAHGNPLVVWLVTAAIPAIVAILLLLNPRDRMPVLAIVCGLLYVEAVLTASQFVI